MISRIKNPQLARQGEKNFQWALSQMPLMQIIQQEFALTLPFKGLAIGMALHVTKETAVLVKTLIAGGAKVAIASCNPLSTQDDIAAFLAKEKIAVFARKGETKKEYYKNLTSVVEFMKNQPGKLATIDDGMDLVALIHQKYPALIKRVIGGAEETTTGVIRLRAMEKDQKLRYPVIAVNDSGTKHLMDNYIGTGQSTIDGILRATSILLAGKKVVVAGFGDCGKGVARRAEGMAAKVVVVETDPLRALQATMEGYEVMPMLEATKIGDIFITVTGNRDIITAPAIKKMKSGAIVCNSGHFDIEIDVAWMKKTADKIETIRPQLEGYHFGNKIIYLLAQGRLVNLAAGEGHPSAIMAMSFANQAYAILYLTQNQLQAGVHTLPKKIDQRIAALQLKAWGLNIDQLTARQKTYLNSWQTGT